MKTLRTVFFCLVLGLLALSACAPAIPITGSGDAEATQAYEIAQAVRATSTASAMLTEIARLQTEVARPSATVVPPTDVPPTAVPVETQPEPTATAVPPTATAIPLPPTPVPTNTKVPPTPTATKVPLPCNDARFVEDVSIKDGTEVFTGQSFTKTWRLRNTGACTWTTDYDLVFINGSDMGSPAAVRVPYQVARGETLDISVDLTAPKNKGIYRGYWMLRDAAGNLFGSGAADEAFYVEIRVTAAPEYNPLQLSSYHCKAEWSSGAGTLPCMGETDDERGYVRRVAKPVLESGYIDDEPALVVHPQMVTDGVIRGKFPKIRIEKGWHFTSTIGCGRGFNRCDVKFQLDYQIGDGSIKTLKSWSEVYDEEFQSVDVDLSKLAGKDVKLILTVFANGSSRDDQAIWLAPQIKTTIGWEKPKE